MPDASSLTLSFDPTGDLLAAAEACEADVFFATYGNTREQWHEEYGPYDASSAFLAVAEPGGDVVAACRIILPGAIGLKSLADTARPPWQVDGYRSAAAAGVDAAQTIDVATVAVRKGRRRGGAMAAVSLYHGIAMVTRANALPNIVMIMDERARRLLSAIGLATHALPGTAPGPYLGSSSSLPLWAHMPTMLDNQRVINPDGFRLVSQGMGLTGIDVPSLEGFAVRPRVSIAERAMVEHV